MFICIFSRPSLFTLVLLGATCAAIGQATSPGLEVRTLAEVEVRSTERGREVVHLVTANRVSPGDEIKYTVEARNVGEAPVRAPVIVQAIPAHTVYIQSSASGPGAEVRFSVDGGHHFDRAENLKVTDASGKQRAAVAADYTHVRWRLKNSLNANSVAFARFRALVK